MLTTTQRHARGLPDQSQMALMQVAHGGNESNRLLGLQRARNSGG